MYVLDTNVVSETRRMRPHRAVVSWLSSVSARDLYVSAVTIGELQAGLELTRTQDPLRASELETWLVNEVMATYEILDLDSDAFREWARIMRGKSGTLMLDAMIAATAGVHGYTVATRNVNDFGLLGVPFLNPFETHH